MAWPLRQPTAGRPIGGQAQRVALRGSAGSPALLLLDEPLSALDARTVWTFRRLVATCQTSVDHASWSRTTPDALVLADRLLVLEDGRIVQEGTPAAVARRPATEYVAKLVGLNLYAGDVDGAKVRLRGGGSFVVPDHDQHGEVLVALRPSAVIISADQPHTSARNSWPAIVVGLTLLTDRVRIDLEGEPSALVDVTPSAVSELELTSGSRVWLTAKATDLEVYGADVPTVTGNLSSPDR